MTKYFSIIIPLFNEEENIVPCFEQLKQFRRKSSGRLCREIICINDGSTDASLSELKEIALHDPLVQIISFRKNLGKAAALRSGFMHASSDICVTLDADLQDDPENIPLLIEHLDKGYDMVVGWRKVRHDPWDKTLPSKVFNGILHLITRLDIHDFNCGLKVMRKDVIQEMYLYGELYRFMPLLAFQRGFQVSEIPITHHPRIYGESKYGPGRFVSGYFDLLTVLFLGSFNQRPLHFFGTIGTVGIIIGTVFGVYLSILHFQGESIGRRPLLLLSMLLILTGLQLISTGLIAELIISKSKQNEQLPINFETGKKPQ